jgi:diguanylate cyclase (GGDEF)-like protein
MHNPGALIEEARGHLNAGRSQAALALAEEALAAAREASTPRALAAALHLNGEVRLARSEYPQAMTALLEALELWRSLDERDHVIACLHSVGQIDMHVGNLSAAAEAFSEALELARDHAPSTEGRLLQRLGMLYARFGDIDKAKEFHELSVELHRGLGDEAGMASSLNSIGTLFLRRSEATRTSHPKNSSQALLRARSYLEEAYSIATRTVDKHLQGLIIGNIGSVVARLGHVEDAIGLMESQLQIVQETGDRYNESLSLANIGEALHLLGRDVEAIEVLTRSLAIGAELDSPERQRRAHEELTHCYEAIEDYRLAFHHFKRFYEFDTAIREELNESQIRDLKVQVAVNEVRKEAEGYRNERDRLARDNLRLHDQAYLDGLTGLANRRRLDDALIELFDRVNREKKPLAIALADIDHFKQINDQYTHATGDRVLQQVARLLHSACRDGDLVARYGGEEFALVLLGLELEGALRVCERIRSSIEANDWAVVHPQLKVTLSIGVTDDVRLGSGPSMLAVADQKLYEAKRGGRNRVCH